MVGNSVGERVFQLAVSLVQVTAYCCRCASCRTAPHLARQWCAWWQLPDGAGSRAGFPGISTGREQIQHLHSAGWCLDKKKNTQNLLTTWNTAEILVWIKKVWAELDLSVCLPSGVKHSELTALWCQCRVVYVYSLLWLKFLLKKTPTKETFF